ncbi:MAG: serine/threonine protein kinase [Clostridia bacterium]|jgi:serine/threonine protein kinase|nr:serine/threonine protein kinase [Clostridia bacterium]
MEQDSSVMYPNALSAGTILNGQYLIERVLGQGGFGITYLAADLNLEIKVAIKEYYPEGMVTRSHASTKLSVYAGEKKEYFEYGAERFLEEAKILARFQSNPNIVGVRTFFKENNTAYFVMDYIEGISFKQYLKLMGGKILYTDALALLIPIMDALVHVHKSGLLHRDISPDNIYLTNNRESKLLDFGAARYTLGEHSKSLSVILKPGYAPEEQYRSKGRQGPWTDIYALGATLYVAITGQVPPDALDRLYEDDLRLPTELGIALPKHIENTIFKALSLRSSDRYQDMESFQRDLIDYSTQHVGSDTDSIKPMQESIKTVPTPLPMNSISPMQENIKATSRLRVDEEKPAEKRVRRSEESLESSKDENKIGIICSAIGALAFILLLGIDYGSMSKWLKRDILLGLVLIADVIGLAVSSFIYGYVLRNNPKSSKLLLRCSLLGMVIAGVFFTQYIFYNDKSLAVYARENLLPIQLLLGSVISGTLIIAGFKLKEALKIKHSIIIGWNLFFVFIIFISIMLSSIGEYINLTNYIMFVILIISISTLSDHYKARKALNK